MRQRNSVTLLKWEQRGESWHGKESQEVSVLVTRKSATVKMGWSYTRIWRSFSPGVMEENWNWDWRAAYGKNNEGCKEQWGMHLERLWNLKLVHLFFVVPLRLSQERNNGSSVTLGSYKLPGFWRQLLLVRTCQHEFPIHFTFNLFFFSLAFLWLCGRENIFFFFFSDRITNSLSHFSGIRSIEYNGHYLSLTVNGIRRYSWIIFISHMYDCLSEAESSFDKENGDWESMVALGQKHEGVNYGLQLDNNFKFI